MMDVDFLPEHLLIVGGSYIGLEFAQMYRRLGSRVTAIEMGPRLVAREDEDVSDEVEAILEREGVEFRLSSKCLRAARDGDAVRVGMDCEGRDEEVSGSPAARHRTNPQHPRSRSSRGRRSDRRARLHMVDEELRTNVPGIWALGEANGRGAFTHTSYNDYEIVAANLLERTVNLSPVTRRFIEILKVTAPSRYSGEN